MVKVDHFDIQSIIFFEFYEKGTPNSNNLTFTLTINTRILETYHKSVKSEENGER